MSVMPGPEWFDSRVTLAINLQLKPGRHGASARVEMHPRNDGIVAVVLVRGRLDRVALRRLAQTLEDLAARGVRRLLLDCSQLRDIRLGLVSPLMDSLARFESRVGRYAVCGLSQHLRDRFRYAGCETDLHSRTSAADLLAFPLALGPSGEWVS